MMGVNKDQSGKQPTAHFGGVHIKNPYANNPGLGWAYVVFVLLALFAIGIFIFWKQNKTIKEIKNKNNARGNHTI